MFGEVEGLERADVAMGYDGRSRVREATTSSYLCNRMSGLRDAVCVTLARIGCMLIPA